MDLDIVLTDTDRVEARAGDRVIVTDQNGEAPAPFDLFLASVGTCAGFYVGRFCHRREISTADIRIRQRAIRDPGTGLVERIEIEVSLPDAFPEKYRGAVLRAAEQCSVKKHLARPPTVSVRGSRIAAGAG